MALETQKPPISERLLCLVLGYPTKGFTSNGRLTEVAMIVKCLDCDLPYSEMGLDLVLPDQQWKKIFPEESGLLCANCICKRAKKLGGSVLLTWIQAASLVVLLSITGCVPGGMLMHDPSDMTPEQLEAYKAMGYRAVRCATVAGGPPVGARITSVTVPEGSKAEVIFGPDCSVQGVKLLP